MDLTHYQPKIGPKNRELLEQAKQLGRQYEIVGVVEVNSLPALQFQRIRASLKGKSEVLIMKRNILDFFLEEFENSYPGITKMAEKVHGTMGLIFTNENPFAMYKLAQKSKSPAPAKAGAVAPKDVVVPAGPTGFSPGPIIGELGAFKIKAGINQGKVEIKEDAVVAKEGEVISEKLAGILTRMGIEPMEVGLNIKAMHGGDILYEKDTLEVDEEAVLEDFRREATSAFHLALGLHYPTPETVPVLLGKAARDAFGLAYGIEYPTDLTVKPLISKAYAQGVGVGLKLPEDIRPAGITAVASSGAAVAGADASANEVEEEKKSEEESSEDVASGFGGFF
jgi:large subunit ribosomal protein L10